MSGFGHWGIGMQGRDFASVALMIAGLMVLGGCTTTQTKRVWTPVQYASYIEAMRGSPALRRSELDKCQAQIRAIHGRRAELGKILNMPPNRDPVPLFCQRIVGALVSGRLNYSDYQNSKRSVTTPKVIRVIQGR